MVKHNNPIVTSHFKKDWVERVRTNFNQPAKALKRKQKRLQKAAQIFPRPLKGSFKPVIRMSGAHNNIRLRLGEGFTPAEIKAAKLGVQFARTVGIAVDTRRRNKSEEGFQRNVQRLLEYKSKLVLFPKHKVTTDKNVKKATKMGGVDDATLEQRKNVTQLKGTVLPTKKQEQPLELREITDADRNVKAWRQLRNARKEQRAYARRIQKKLNPVIEVGKKKEEEGEKKEKKEKKEK